MAPKRRANCQICSDVESKYVCSNCNILYCSVSCYKAHRDTLALCSERASRPQPSRGSSPSNSVPPHSPRTPLGTPTTASSSRDTSRRSNPNVPQASNASNAPDLEPGPENEIRAVQDDIAGTGTLEAATANDANLPPKSSHSPSSSSPTPGTVAILSQDHAEQIIIITEPTSHARGSPSSAPSTSKLGPNLVGGEEEEEEGGGGGEASSSGTRTRGKTALSVLVPDSNDVLSPPTTSDAEGGKAASTTATVTTTTTTPPLDSNGNGNNNTPELTPPHPEPVPLRKLTSLKWPYVPEQPSYPDPLTRDDPKPLSLAQFEAIATSPAVRHTLASHPRLRTLLCSIDQLRGPARSDALERVLGVSEAQSGVFSVAGLPSAANPTPTSRPRYGPRDAYGVEAVDEEDMRALRALAEAVESAVRGEKTDMLGLDWEAMAG